MKQNAAAVRAPIKPVSIAPTTRKRLSARYAGGSIYQEVRSVASARKKYTACNRRYRGSLSGTRCHLDHQSSLPEQLLGLRVLILIMKRECQPVFTVKRVDVLLA